jgi:hypothetical protein
MKVAIVRVLEKDIEKIKERGFIVKKSPRFVVVYFPNEDKKNEAAAHVDIFEVYANSFYGRASDDAIQIIQDKGCRVEIDHKAEILWEYKEKSKKP